MDDKKLPRAVAGLIEQAVADSVDLGVLTFDSDGVLMGWNAGAKRLFQYEKDEVVGDSGLVIFTPEDRITGEAAREVNIAASEGKANDERWHLRKDGSRFWANGLLLSVRDDAGLVRGFVKVIQDRTAEKRIEESLRQHEEEFARIFLGNPAAIAVQITATRRFMLANERFFELIGYWRAEAMGKTGDELRLWKDSRQRDEAWKQIASDGQSSDMRVDIRSKDGQIKNTIASFRSTTLGGQECVIGTYIDATGLIAG
jgi:PAS domain S-box-containing protein